VTGAIDVNGVGGKHAHHHSSADSICMTADKKEPDAVRLLPLFTSAEDCLIFTPQLLLVPDMSDHWH